jgi:hypothetical protein
MYFLLYTRTYSRWIQSVPDRFFIPPTTLGLEYKIGIVTLIKSTTSYLYHMTTTSSVCVGIKWVGFLFLLYIFLTCFAPERNRGHQNGLLCAYRQYVPLWQSQFAFMVRQNGRRTFCCTLVLDFTTLGLSLDRINKKPLEYTECTVQDTNCWLKTCYTQWRHKI